MYATISLIAVLEDFKALHDVVPAALPVDAIATCVLADISRHAIC